LPGGLRVPILYEDHSVLAIDKPARWMLAPAPWHETGRNLLRQLMLSIQAGDSWARARKLRYLRHVHRLDAQASGVLLLAKSPGALRALSRLFQTRQVQKKYLALVQGVPERKSWTCRLKLAPKPGPPGRMKVDAVHGKAAETHFRVLQVGPGQAWVQAEPITGRTHQIRLHLAAGGHPIVGDALYGGSTQAQEEPPLQLRAIELRYRDPFRHRPVRITAPPSGGLLKLPPNLKLDLD
jgi:RluA family pseudouridine synthase